MLRTGPCFSPPERCKTCDTQSCVESSEKSYDSLDDVPHEKTSIYVMSALLKPRRASPETTQGFSSNHAGFLLKPRRVSPQTTQGFSSNHAASRAPPPLLITRHTLPVAGKRWRGRATCAGGRPQSG